jgi:hypothetical protein
MTRLLLVLRDVQAGGALNTEDRILLAVSVAIFVFFVVDTVRLLWRRP